MMYVSPSLHVLVKFMGATCLSEELGRLKKKNAWVSSESRRLRIECLQDCSAILNRVVALKYSQVHKKA